MKINLDKIENKLKHLFENRFSRSSTNVFHNRLAEELCGTILRTAREDEDGNLVAPNKFSFNLPQDIFQTIENKNELADDISKTLQELISDTGIKTLAPITLSFSLDTTLSTDDLKMNFEFSGSTVTNTSVYEVNKEWEQKTDDTQTHAYLLFKGQLIVIDEPVFNIGRGDGNNLIIENRYISRAHAQIRYINQKYVIFDLNSSGGTYLNGKRIKKQSLQPGDLITLSKTEIVFGIENESTLADTSKYTIS